jgi:hypothetical protein
LCSKSSGKVFPGRGNCTFDQWCDHNFSHLGLGRACLLQGGTAKARACDQDLLTLSKDVDSEDSILTAAKSE